MIRIATLLSGHGITAAATLARNLMLARLLGPEHYAIAVGIAILVAGAEMVTTLGLPQFIVSHERGNTRKLQAALHMVHCARGVVGAGLVLLCAAPLAQLLNTPSAAPAFQSAAAVPLILGLIHLDPYRAQRHQIHMPQILTLCVPAAVSLLALGPIIALNDGPESMLYVLLLQACATVLTSHATARCRYRFAFTPAITAHAVWYGLPLALNGALMFTVLHAEKFIAGARLGLEEMGLLAMGFTLTLTPALIGARCLQAYHLPRLRQKSDNALGASFLLGASLAAFLALTVPLAVPALGAGFTPLVTLIPLLSCLAATRLPKSALSTAALAQGRTYLPPLANLPRLLMAPIIWLTLSHGGSVQSLLSLAVLAEGIGLLVGILVGHRGAFPVTQAALALGATTLIIAGQPTFAALLCLGGWIMHLQRPNSPVRPATA
ncbi:oligosaccharide flippase family protein [Litoreibacter albidus]|uniref:Membrane protein involved in the export of O-antigen and teichoic acid n=1 Tax=Litoreibacter albidus TaxID=670155 RepID=A0A1H2W5A8_9RHOB|nr:oligosaccharide flippase family protein [Litoreibacter albidus]SDW75717.1 Membrane protein involved in the export of O-antigen and teichoic acid [Litoreibacter albidus]